MKNKGITLVALVITIIILLILAGITISQLTGSGLFENAKLAKEKSDNAQKLEDETLKDYENKIDQYLNNSREQVMVDKDEYESLKSKVLELDEKINKKSSPILIESDYKSTASNIPANTWTTLETVPLNEYGTGKAYISYSLYGDSNAINVQLADNNGVISVDRGVEFSRTTTLAGAVSGAISYDETTVLYFQCYDIVSEQLMYGYSILLFPD